MEAPEEDTEFLTLTQPVKGVTLRLSDTFYDQETPCTAEPGHLLAVSNQFGWVVAVNSRGGFGLFSLSTLRSTVESATPHDTPRVEPKLAVSTPAPVDFLRFAMGDKLILAGLRDGTVSVWRLKSLVEGQPEPLRTLQATAPGTALIDLCPNPAPDSPLLAVLSPAAPLTIYNLETASVHATFPTDLGATSACWSVKGKQLAVGTASAAIVQFTPEGEQKAVVPPPSNELASLGGTFEVRSVEWLENNVFLATYARPRTASEEDVQHEDEVFAITKVGSEVQYTKFADPCPPFGMMGRQGRRWVGRFKNWEPFKHLLVMVNAPSADIGVLAQAGSYSPTSISNGWATLTLPEDTRPTMPTGDLGDDACPLALELDLSGPNEPAVLVYTSRGALVYWTFKNERAKGRYGGMIESRDVLTQEGETAAVSVETKPAPSASSSPAAASTPSAFGAFASPSTSTTSAPAFGSTLSAPAFGAKPTFGTSAAPAFGGASAFGSSTSKPAFGATSSPFGAASTPSAFGSASPSAAPAFGSTSSLGFGASGSSSPSAKPATTSPFATATTSAASTPASGSAFAAVPSSGGFSAFGFGSTGGFGAAAGTSSTPKASPFGSGSAFGAAPAFGASTSSTSTKPASPAAGGFASFGTATGSSASSTGGFGGFGGFGSSGTKSVFGAPSTPGTSAFGSGGTAPAAGASKFSFAPTASRGGGGRGSDDEDEDEGDMVDEAKERADEPPDLEPTKVGLDFAQSVREAEKAGPPKRENAPATGAATSSSSGSDALSGGFGSLGFGGGVKQPSDEVKPPTVSVFGSAAASSTTPAAATVAKPAFGFGSATRPSPFGGSSFGFGASTAKAADATASKPTSAFGSGGFAGFAPTSTAPKDTGEAKPTFSFAPKPAETPSEEPTPAATKSASPASPAATSQADSKSPAFSFAPTAPEATKSEEKKPTGSAFGFGGTAPSGGFGAFATSDNKSTPDKEERNAPEPAKSKEVESAPVESTAEDEAEEDEEPEVSEQQDNDEEEEEDEQEPSLEASSQDGSGSDASGAEEETPAEPAAPSKPAFSFASSTAPAFPKPAASGGFGAFSGSGGSSSGFGFGAAASGKTPSSTGFGFGVATTPSPSTAGSSGFSFAPKASASSDAASKPAFSFAPQKSADDSSKPTEKPAFSFAPKPTPEPVPIPAAEEKPKDSTKSLFGFASSPPGEKSRSGGENSLLSRIGAKEVASEEEPSAEEEEEEEVEDDVDDDEEEGEEDASEEEDQEGEQSEEDNEEETVATPSSQPSLLSRLSPAPASPSPAPVSEPAATSTPSFSFAPAKPSASAAAAPSEPSPKPPTFSFAAPPASSPANSTPTSPAPIVTSNLGSSTSPFGAPKSPGGFLNFTSTAPRASSPLSAPPLAAQAAPAVPKSTSPAPSLGLFGANTAKPAFSFGNASAPPTSLGTSKPSPAPTSPAPISTVPLTQASEKKSVPAPTMTPPAPVPEPEAPRALSVVSTPVQKLGSQLIAAGAASAPAVTEKGMAGEFLKAYLSVQQDFELLRKNSTIIKDFVDALGRPCHAPLSKGVKPSLEAKDWSFGDVDKLKQLTEDAAPGVETLHAAALAQKLRIVELQSQLLKAETKREEAARFLRARSDPAFAKLVRVRQLGPEQTENQRRIRLQVEAVRTKIEQLEEHLLSLKKQIAREKLGQPTLQAPSLDSIQRAMRNISVAAAEKSFELDELASKLDKLRVRNGSTPSTPRKQQSFGMSPLRAALDQSSLLRQSSPASPHPTLSDSGPAAAEMAAAALGHERVAGNLKKALLSLRTSVPLMNRSACGSQTAQLKRPAAADIQLAFAHGPITGDRLPRPRHYTPPALPQMVASAAGKTTEPRALPAPTAIAAPDLSAVSSLDHQTPSAGSAPPIFPSLDLKGAPSFSFASPVSATPSPSSTSQPGAAPSRGSASRHTSSRVHGGAVQLKSTGTPPPTAASTFDWGPLPATSTSTSTPVKTGNFISLAATPSTPSTPPPAPAALSVKPSFPSMTAESSTPSATPAKPPSGFSFANASTPATPPAAAKALPTFSFAGGSTTPSATPSKPPASFSFATSTSAASPAPATFGFGGAPADSKAAKPSSFSFGTSTPTAKAPTSFSFGGAASGTPAAKPSFNFGGSTAAAATPASVPASKATGEITPKAAADASAEDEEERQSGEEEEESWSGDEEEYGEEEYGESGGEDEEGLEAISEHTEED